MGLFSKKPKEPVNKVKIYRDDLADVDEEYVPSGVTTVKTPTRVRSSVSFNQEPKVPKRALCPKCGSQNIQPVGQRKKNFSVGKAVAGGVIFNPVVGAIAGATGRSSKKLTFYCHDCGKQFER